MKKLQKKYRKKCGIKTAKRYNEKENIIEMWQKVSDVKIQIKRSNVLDVALKRIKNYYGKKNHKTSRKKKSKKYRASFKGETGVFGIEKLTCDIIERCKLPGAKKILKKLSYNDDDMVREETSRAEKRLKLSANENIVLNENVNDRKPDIWFKD